MKLNTNSRDNKYTKEIFAYLPIESELKKYQDGYYQAIADCNKNGDSTIFIEFMLKMIDEVLEEAVTLASVPITEKTVNIRKLLQGSSYKGRISGSYYSW